MERFLSQLPKDTAQRIIGKVSCLQDELFDFLDWYAGGDFFPLRVGSYRLLLDVDRLVKVLVIRILSQGRNVHR